MHQNISKLHPNPESLKKDSLAKHFLRPCLSLEKSTQLKTSSIGRSSLEKRSVKSSSLRFGHNSKSLPQEI
jgi:hypothetical protein